MAEPAAPAPQISAATIALALAALLALAAVGAALFRSGGGAAEAPRAEAPAGDAPSLAATIAGLEERLRRDPDDHRGWYLLGMAHRSAGRFAQAEGAFRRAMELAPREADYPAYVAEILLVRAEGRDPPPEAERLLRRAMELDPANPQGRYYLATLKDLRGDHRGAIADLIALLGDAPAGAPWERQVREAALAIGEENDIEVASRLPAPRAAPASTATAAIPGPTREQMEAARGIPPSEQDEMVRGMVDRLDARLRADPRDADGWIRLMRSRTVLNQPDAAREALASALAAFADDAATQARLRGAARELGIS